MEKRLHKAHFQLTDRCNLSCRFCGQTRGMLASTHQELSPEIWLRAADELRVAAEGCGFPPEIMLWGGEPLLYSKFDELASELHRLGFKLGIVTNGTLLDRHAQTICETLDEIFVSMDGIGEVHDSSRGKGVFEKVKKNLALFRSRRGKLVFLTTVSDCNVRGISQLPYAFARELCPDEVVLGQLMYLAPKEIEEYREYSRRHLGCDYPELNGWRREDDDKYLAVLKEEKEKIAMERYPLPVYFMPHTYPESPVAHHCGNAWTRVHIRHDGEVGFCTDYFGFSAGNILQNTLTEIWRGERAELFRRAVETDSLAICRHCPWHMQRTQT